MIPPEDQRDGAFDPDEWQKDVEQVVERVLEAQEAEAEPSPPPSRGPLLGILTVVLVAVFTWNVWLLQAGVPPLSPEEQEEDLAGMLLVLHHQLESFRAVHGVYPPSLDAVAPPLGGITYDTDGEEYTLEARADGVTVQHASSEDAATLARRAGGPDFPRLAR